MSKDKIVDNARRRQILEKVIKEQSFFICHKSSIEGGEVCCRGFYDKLGHYSQLVRIAERLNVVKFVNPIQ